MLFDEEQQCLVCGNKTIKRWKIETKERLADASHEGTIVDVLYNAAFDEIVSADDCGNLCVWYLDSGKLRTRFGRLHGDKMLTAMTLDIHARRLLTTTDDGICYVDHHSLLYHCLIALCASYRCGIVPMAPI